MRWGGLQMSVVRLLKAEKFALGFGLRLYGSSACVLTVT